MLLHEVTRGLPVALHGETRTLAPVMLLNAPMLIVAGVVLFVVAACVRAIWLAITLPRACLGSPACEACGYEVADLSGFVCPECGRDLRASGIITPAMEARRRGSLSGAILAWLFIVGFAGMMAWVVTIAVLESGPPRTAPLDRSGLRWRAGAMLAIPATAALLGGVGAVYIVRQRRALVRGAERAQATGR